MNEMRRGDRGGGEDLWGYAANSAFLHYSLLALVSPSDWAHAGGDVRVFVITKK